MRQSSRSQQLDECLLLAGKQSVERFTKAFWFECPQPKEDTHLFDSRKPLFILEVRFT